MAADRLRDVNELPEDEAARVLQPCCASATWVARVLAGRPYAGVAELLDAAERACRELTPAEVDEALAAHPRIGQRAEGASAEAQWSRQEQASVAGSDAAVQERLREGNRAYEERFGRVFLVRAAGRTPQEMLAELERRLRNDDETEQREVVEQLAQITRLRVERLVAG